MKNILLLGTGGTIASANTPNGLAPAYSADELISLIPDMSAFCHIDSIQLFNIDSTNMQPEHWKQIARTIKDNFEKYDGFVITHGTDTMAYTASILSYMIQNSPKPIVLTGAQKPIHHMPTDAKMNLSDSIRFACEDFGGVFIVFNGSVINGCHAIKIRTKSYHAFESVNFPIVASIRNFVVHYNPEILQKRTFSSLNKNVIFNICLSDSVFLFKLVPGTNPKILDIVGNTYKGIVIETFGAGGIPFIGSGNILEKIQALTKSNVTIVVTTQVLYEGANLNIYEVGKKLLSTSIIPAYDMTSEAAITKLMWILGQTDDYTKIRKLFLSPVSDDLHPIE